MSSSILTYGVLASLSIGHARGKTFRFEKRANARPAANVGGTSNGGDEEIKVGNSDNMRYTSNITINGVDVHIALDTGSTDLWVSPPEGIGSFNDSGMPLALKYGDGSYGVSGTIGVSPFEFGEYQIDQQAFLYGRKNTIQSLTELGVYGVLGLAFQHGNVSPINIAVKKKYGKDATWGRSVLHNIFDRNPSEPNFIAIDLARSDDLEDTLGGSFDIGEYNEKYAAVAQAPKLAQFPKGGNRWATLLDGVTVDGAAVKLKSTAKGVPKGKMQALLDTGDPTAIIPVSLFDGIYSKIPGAVLWVNEKKTRRWLVPCNSTASVSFNFGGQEFPVHPLDMTEIFTIPGKDAIACRSSFKAVDGWTVEISLGDSFLRNVYSVYDFGDNLPNGKFTEPYMQLLAQTEPTKAAAQVASIRGKSMETMLPEMEPAALYSKLLEEGSVSLAASSGDSSAVEALLHGTTGIALVALLAVNFIVVSVVAVFFILNFMRARRRPKYSLIGGGGPSSSASGYAAKLKLGGEEGNKLIFDSKL